MEKPADTHYPIHDILRHRWSPRAFTDQPIEIEKLGSLLEAARWASSCFNEQPWSFIVARKEEADAYAQVLSCLVEGNQLWAQRAPVLMLTIVKPTFEHNGKPNKHAWHDVGLAVGNLVMQATDMGLGVHQLAGIYPDQVRSLYEIPEGHEPVSALAIGYRGDPASLPEGLQAKELAARSRKKLEEFVYAGRWGQAFSFTR